MNSASIEQLVKEFPDQTELIGRARIRLAALGSVASKPKEMTMRQVWSGDIPVMNPPSPDGRYLASITDKGDLNIRDLQTREEHQLTHAKTGSDESAPWAAWSPDGRRIAFNWINAEGSIDLRVIGSDGSNPLTVYGAKGANAGTISSWFPDGKSVLVISGTHQLARISITDGKSQVIRSFEGTFVTPRCLLSPDGRFMAYALLKRGTGNEADLYICPVAEGDEVPLVLDKGREDLVGWTADGQWILFTSRRGGNLGLWRISVKDGKPEGEPELIKGEMGEIRPLGMTGSGSVFYGRDSNLTDRDVFVATLDFASGNVTVPPKRINDNHIGSVQSPAWSPDGGRLAYLAATNPDEQFGVSTLCVWTAQDGLVTEHILGVRLVTVRSLTWSADGHSILAKAYDRIKVEYSYLRIDADTGDVSIIAGLGYGDTVASTSDGRLTYDIRADPSGRKVIAHDRLNERETELYSYNSGSWLGFPLSPDGKWLALHKHESAEKAELVVIPTAGGPARTLVNIPKEFKLYHVGWTPDSRYVVYSQYGAEAFDKPFQLWTVPIEGGTPRKLGLTMDKLGQMNFHPDGKRIAFSAGGSASQSEVWVLENILPPAKAAR